MDPDPDSLIGSGSDQKVSNPDPQQKKSKKITKKFLGEAGAALSWVVTSRLTDSAYCTHTPPGFVIYFIHWMFIFYFWTVYWPPSFQFYPICEEHKKSVHLLFSKTSLHSVGCIYMREGEKFPTLLYTYLLCALCEFLLNK